VEVKALLEQVRKLSADLAQVQRELAHMRVQGAVQENTRFDIIPQAEQKTYGERSHTGSYEEYTVLMPPIVRLNPNGERTFSRPLKAGEVVEVALNMYGNWTLAISSYRSDRAYFKVVVQPWVE
jgi:hypothetical protein